MDTPRKYNSLQRLSYSHEALIDLIVANPAATSAELAQYFGFVPETIRRLRSSDLFRMRLKQRTTELVDPTIVASVNERFEMLTSRSLDVLLDKISKPSEEVPDNLALAAAQLGAKATSLGGFASKPVVQVTTPDADRIHRLAERLERLNGRQPPTEVIDVETVSVPSQTGAGGIAANSD